MKNERYVAVLDVGTTKVFTIVGKVTDDHIEIISLGKSQSAGVRKGVVVDIEAAVSAIEESVKDAEEQADIEIKDIYVGIAGEHITCRQSNGVVGIKDGVVRQGDVDRVMDSAKAVYVPLDREVLHIVPVEYSVDGENEILHPIGMRGVRLESIVKIVTGSVTSIHNLLKCCERVGLHVPALVLEPLASGYSALREDEKEHGCILVDIGGGTTDITLFRNDTFIDTSVLGIGGNHITNDIAVALRLPVTEAERVKKEHGTIFYSEGKNDESVTIKVAGRDEKTIKRDNLTEIIHPRCEELMNLIREEIVKMYGYDLAPYGVVLTGGSSMLHGIDRMAEEILKMPVRVGMPEEQEYLESVRNPLCSTVVGLLLFAQKNAFESKGSNKKADPLSGLFSRVRSWAGGFFR